MTEIFAQYGTTKRIAIYLHSRVEVMHTQERLNKEHGGEWLLVQKLEWGQGIEFNGEEAYRGFDGKEDYCGNLIQIFK